MSDLFGNHIVGFPTRRLISLRLQMKRNRIYVDFFVCYSESERSLPDTTTDHGRGAKAI